MSPRGLGAVVMAAWLAGCGDPGASERAAPSLLLVTFDTTRADRVGAYGSRSGLTPTLDRLAREGVLFEAAVAPTPITLPSHTSILSGVYPTAHGVRDNGIFRLGPAADLVSEALGRHGWRTAAFVGSAVLDARYGLDQGFEVYRGPPPSPDPGRAAERPADRVVEEAGAWLAGLAPGERFFVWVHFYDPHEPYQAPEPWAERFESAYDAEIAFADAQLGRLLERVDQSGRARELVVVATADHGESLGEHGEQTHGVLAYQSSLHVPLIVAGARGAGAGVRVKHGVSTAAVAPTLLALAGLPAQELPHVRIPPLLSAAGEPATADSDRAVYLESLMPYYAFRWHALRGLVWRDLKLIVGREPELYALADDPSESSDLAASEPDRVAALRTRLDALVSANAPLGWVGELDPGAEERRMLESLGYVAAAPGDRPFDPGLPDPRRRIGDEKRLERAINRFRRGQQLEQESARSAGTPQDREARARRAFESARAILEKLAPDNPDNPQIVFYLGVVRSALGDHAAAAALLERSVRLEPRSQTAHYDLALAYAALGRDDEARREMQQSAWLDPSQPAPYEWLASHHEARGEYGRAAWWLARLSERIEADGPSRRALDGRLERVRAEMRARGQTPSAPPGAAAPAS